MVKTAGWHEDNQILRLGTGLSQAYIWREPEGDGVSDNIPASNRIHGSYVRSLLLLRSGYNAPREQYMGNKP